MSLWQINVVLDVAQVDATDDVLLERGDERWSLMHDVLVPADLEAAYDVGAGELILDLTALELVDDQSVKLEMGAGSLVVILPRDMAVDVTAEARFGDVRLLDRSDEGVGIELTEGIPGKTTSIYDQQQRIGA